MLRIPANLRNIPDGQSFSKTGLDVLKHILATGSADETPEVKAKKAALEYSAGQQALLKSVLENKDSQRLLANAQAKDQRYANLAENMQGQDNAAYKLAALSSIQEDPKNAQHSGKIMGNFMSMIPGITQEDLAPLYTMGHGKALEPDQGLTQTGQQQGRAYEHLVDKREHQNKISLQQMENDRYAADRAFKREKHKDEIALSRDELALKGELERKKLNQQKQKQGALKLGTANALSGVIDGLNLVDEFFENVEFSDGRSMSDVGNANLFKLTGFVAGSSGRAFIDIANRMQAAELAARAGTQTEGDEFRVANMLPKLGDSDQARYDKIKMALDRFMTLGRTQADGIVDPDQKAKYVAELKAKGRAAYRKLEAMAQKLNPGSVIDYLTFGEGALGTEGIKR